MKNVLLGLLLLISGSALAEPKTLIECHASGPKIPKLYIELFELENGKLLSRYAFGSNPLYESSRTNAGKVVTPPVRLPRLLKELNQYKNTGIQPDQVKLFQGVFVDGNGSYDIELWKLMDENENLLGWTAYAYGEALGCY